MHHKQRHENALWSGMELSRKRSLFLSLSFEFTVQRAARVYRCIPMETLEMKYVRLDLSAPSFRVGVVVASACDGTIANRRTCFINVRVPRPTTGIPLADLISVQTSSTYLRTRMK